MVQIGVSLGSDTVEEFLCKGGIGERHPEFAGIRQCQVQIFLVQCDPEAGVKCSLDHALAMDLEDFGRRKTAHQRLTDFCRVCTRFGREQQGLAHRLDG